ncbi:hypothetical protein JCM6882_006953 [Rhodosporidiobolus microsporus]
MHSFFTTGFEPLHAHIVDLLAEDGVHSLLPLLGVNHEWRKLAVKRMLKVYNGTLETVMKRDKLARVPREDEGECILFFWGRLCPDGPEERDDPRSNIAGARLVETDGLRIGALFFTSFDPSTMACTFKPADARDGIHYELACNGKRDEWPDAPACFVFRPTGWFRSSTPESTAALCGLELAARPDRHPPCFDCLLHPKEPPKPPHFLLGSADHEVTDKQSKLREEEKLLDFCGTPWTACYTAERFDWRIALEEIGSGRCDVPARLTVHELKVPFIDLFVPRKSSVTPEHANTCMW